MPKIIENVKEKIIIYSKKKLILSGYASLNIRDISKNCDISIGTFYNYFKNKDDLVECIFRNDWDKMIFKIKKLNNTSDLFNDNMLFIYKQLGIFIDNYSSVFYELSINFNNPNCPNNNKFSILYNVMEPLIQTKYINNTISSRQLCELLVSNFIYLHKNPYIEFSKLLDYLLK